MPSIKLQEIVFALTMSLVMVFGMEQYNLGISYGGFEMWMLKYAWHWEGIPLMTLIVFIMEHFIAGPVARKKASKLVTPGKDNPLLVTLTTAGCTVVVMCPVMSFWATIIFKHNGLGILLPIYLQTLVCNFPMALLWQVFFAGPFTRWLVHKLFNNHFTADVKPYEQRISV